MGIAKTGNELHEPTIAPNAPGILWTLEQLLACERLSNRDEGYFSFNIQTACPPGIAVPVDQGRRGRLFHDKLDLVGVKDRLGHWTHYQYNSLRQLMALTNANNAVTLYQYCGCGSPDQIVQLNGSRGLTNSFAYDMGGRLTNAVYADGYEVNRSYDPSTGPPEEITDSGGHVIYPYFVWMNLGFALDYANASDGSTSKDLIRQAYDKYGRRASSVDRNGVTLALSYDLLNRVKTRQLTNTDFSVGQRAESFVYDARGLTNYFDPAGKLTSFVRDAAGRVLYETNANQQVLGFTYWPDGQLNTLKDGLGHTTTWARDVYGRITRKTLADGQDAFRYYYNAAGQLTNRWSAGASAGTVSSPNNPNPRDD